MQQELIVNLKEQGDVTVFELKGDLTASSEPFLKRAYEDAGHRGTKKILLQFDAESYINSGGIAILIQILAQTRQNHQIVKITGLSDHFKKIFGMVGITKFAAICDTAQEAIEEMSGKDL
jgi:anti-anti-sigma factor